MSRTKDYSDKFSEYIKFLNGSSEDDTLTVSTEWLADNPERVKYDPTSQQFQIDTSNSTSTSASFTLNDSSDNAAPQGEGGLVIPSGRLSQDVAPLAGLLRQSEGSGARLRIGRYLSHYHSRGYPYDLLRHHLKRDENVDLPSDGRCSVYRGAYDAWLGQDVKSSILAKDDATNARMRIPDPGTQVALEDGSLVRLADFPIDKLYLLRHQLREKPVEAVLAMAREHNEGELRAILKGHDISHTDPEAPVSDVATLRLPRSIYKNLEFFVDRLRTVTGKHDISWGAALEFMLGQFNPTELDDAALEFLWRHAHGELTPEEGEELNRTYYTTQ